MSFSCRRASSRRCEEDSLQCFEKGKPVVRRGRKATVPDCSGRRSCRSTSQCRVCGTFRFESERPRCRRKPTRVVHAYFDRKHADWPRAFVLVSRHCLPRMRAIECGRGAEHSAEDLRLSCDVGRGRLRVFVSTERERSGHAEEQLALRRDQQAVLGVLLQYDGRTYRKAQPSRKVGQHSDRRQRR